MNRSTKERLTVDVLPDCDPEIGRALWALEDTRHRTKAGLAGLADSVLDWTPTPTENSIGSLLYHIAAIETDWLYAEVLEEPFPPDVAALFPDDVRDSQDRLARANGTSLAFHFRRLDATRSRVLTAFRGMSVDEFRRVRDLPEYGVTPEWVLHHVMQHEAEHRGQMGVLRALAEQASTGRQ